MLLYTNCRISKEVHNKYVLNVCVFARVHVWEKLSAILSQSAASTLTRAGARPLEAAVRVFQVVPWTGRHSEWVEFT